MTSAAPFTPRPEPTPLLSINNITSAYGRIEVLHELALTIAPGETVALVGANGAGKSTLLRVISGLQPASGEIRFDGSDLSRGDAADRVRRGIVQVPEGRQVFSGLSVEDNLMLGAYTPERQSRYRRGPGKTISTRPHPQGQAASNRRHAVRRPTANVGHGPRPDGTATAVAAGRTEHGPGAADH